MSLSNLCYALLPSLERAEACVEGLGYLMQVIVGSHQGHNKAVMGYDDDDFQCNRDCCIRSGDDDGNSNFGNMRG